MIEYQPETLAEYEKLTKGTVSQRAHRLGLDNQEPLIVAMDALLRYAKAYEKRWERKLAEDGFLGDEWLNAAKGIRALLNGDGAVAMAHNITTDSKDNGAVESMFWAAMEASGFKESDL